jgi:hypothetical protein
MKLWGEGAEKRPLPFCISCECSVEITQRHPLECFFPIQNQKKTAQSRGLKLLT